MIEEHGRAEDDDIWVITGDFDNKTYSRNSGGHVEAATIEVNNHPQLKLALHFVTKIPNAIIAGGAARDILMNKKLSDKTDIDIFIGGENSESGMARQLIEITSFCRSLNITPHLVNDESNMPGLRLKAGNLDLFLLGYMPDSIFDLVTRFDMVSSQAWLVPWLNGFNVHCTELSRQLRERNVMGYYPGYRMDSSNHIFRVSERFPEHVLLQLSYRATDDNYNDPLPF